MNKIKLLSLFSGIGAFEKALDNLEINYELIGFSEIKKISIKGYCALHVLEMIFRSLFKCNKNLNQNLNQQTLF